MNARTSLLSLLDDAAARGEEFAFVQRRGLRVERWTYAQLVATAYQFARELEARGIGKDDRVLLWGANGGAWVAAWFGCLARGAVVVPLDEASAPDFIERIQQQVNAKLIVCDEAISISAQTFSLKGLSETVSHHSAEHLATQRHADDTIQPEDLAQIIFTSGTTAEPKGVCLSHRNLLANLAPLEQGIDEYRKWERWVHPIRFLCLLPLSHVFGQFMGIFVPQLLGGEVHFSDSLNPADIIATVKRERISVIAAVPRQLETGNASSTECGAFVTFTAA
jgi:long-chain acyl-CoA synthetase